MPETESPAVHGRELVVHLFAPLNGPRAVEAYADLQRIWARCHELVGMCHPIGGIPVPDKLPDLSDIRRDTSGLDDVALAGQQATEPVFQAVLRRHHDVVNLSVVLAPTTGTGTDDWIRLDRLWSTIAPPWSGGLLGVARVYQGLMSHQATVDHSSADTLHPLLPVTGTARYWSDGVVTPVGLGVWEVGATDDARPERRLLVLAPDGYDDVLSAWTWSRGDAAMPPLARYLLHAATVRHHLRVRLAAGDPVAEVDLATELVARSPAGWLPDDVLPRLVRSEVAATTLERQLGTMSRSVETTRANMRAALGGEADVLVTGAGPFADDDRLVDWFLTLLADDLSGLAASTGHLRTVAGIVGRIPPENPYREQRSTVPNPRNVFVVHGRDLQVVDAFSGFLRALDLHPLDWEEVVNNTSAATPYLGDVVRQGFENIQAAVVLLTPDDVAYLHPDLHGEDEPEHERQPTGQARPNVLFEAGMAFALHPTRTVLIQVGQLRPFSDIGGRNFVRFDGSVGAMQKVAQRLKNAGCAVNDRGPDWLDQRRFAGLAALTRRP
ncbi:CATRA conflict system CASPASE/TPR repeat-associated protein [Micromonospora sp. CPCC 206060]|uniref:CATRA conflict system CASPASE/TPR repeat-associated protein n=1 Tax=Micromonospora sp. CPCC 206060 TaxID=3122406 RepID=UPI002FF2ED54